MGMIAIQSTKFIALGLFVLSSLFLVSLVSLHSIYGYTVIMAGDFSGNDNSDSVFKTIKERQPSRFIGLGDMTHDKGLSWFKSTYGTEFSHNLKCVLGNHDSSVDGSKRLEAEARELCGDNWFLKEHDVLFLGFNIWQPNRTT